MKRNLSGRRHTRRPAFNVGQTSVFGSAFVVNHQMVLPGESITSHNARLRLQSIPITSRLAGAYFDIMTFLVPYRLLWDGWEDFLVEGTGTLPVMGSNSKDMLLLAGDPQFPELAFDHVIENFFRSPWNPSVTAARLPHIDFLGDQMITDPSVFPDSEKLRMDVQTGTPDFVELEMDELAETQYKERQRNRVKRYSSGYAEMLADYGVNVQEGLVLAEYLGGARSWHYPSRTIDESTGYSVQSYMLDVNWKRDRKNVFSAEHAVLLDIAVLRPKVYPRNKLMSTEGLRTENHHFMMPAHEHDQTYRVDASGMYASMSGELDLRAPLFHGEWRVGQGFAGTGTGEPYSGYYDVAAQEQGVYPDYSAIAGTSDLDSNHHFAIDGKVRSAIRTWLTPPTEPNLDPS